MSTEVVHGPRPQFRSTLTGGTFSLTLVGYYTDVAVDPHRVRTRRGFLFEFWRWLTSFWKNVEPDTQGMGAGGVTEVVYASGRDAKRVNELMVMRTIFRNFYEQEMRRLGRSPTGPYSL